MRPVYFIGAGPGDPELLTLKGRRLLDEAGTVVYAGSLVNPALLKDAGRKAEGGKPKIYDSAGMTLEETTRILGDAARAGHLAVRLHSGDISFYSAITEQIALLQAEGIECVVVPGVSSLGAGAAALGQELTVPEISQTVIVTRMAGRTPVPAPESIASLAAHKSTMVIFLSAGMIESLVTELIKGGYMPETPAAIVERASWPEERVITGSLEDIASKAKQAGIKKTALIYVGKAIGTTGEKKSKLYDGEFSHGFRDKKQKR
ncbi:MAG: precorrin-4 C(11)-methyltransferase [Nitrospiraceae bacterium]|nr:precorrin-4 C(11)-methyltransferase [Nitrospiraceae bacterium]